jgi:hypothetical protein
MIIVMEGRMKRTIGVLLGIGFLAWCGGRGSQVDKIIEDGVEVVLNHLEPYNLKGEPSHLRPEEETRIDFETDEYKDLGLKEPDIVEADSKGNIFVVEKFPDSEYFIYKFSPGGRFIMKFVRKGQGPGEVQGIWDLLLDKNDRLIITDPNVNKAVEFNTEGRLVRETKLAPGLLDVLPLPNGNFLGRRYPKKDSDPVGMYLSLLDPEFKEIKLMDFYDMSGFAPGKKSPGFIVHFCWRVAGDRIYVGNGSRGYEIRVWDFDGNLLRKFRKEFHHVAYPEEFRLQTERIIAAGNKDLFVAKDMPPVNSFFIDEDGRLFAMTYEQGASQDEYIHDVFNRDGILIARVPLGKYGILGRALNRQRATATNGRFYRLRFKESGYPELIVYRMVWE